MGLIKLQSVKKVYQMGEVSVTALKGIDVEIGKGAFISFIGPSGSGKTTLLNLIGCLDKPTSGNLKVMDTNIAKLNYVERAKFRGEHLGFIFQNFNLIPVLTVYENVEYPLVMVKSLPKKEREKKCFPCSMQWEYKIRKIK